MSVSGWMGNENMVYVYNELFFSHKKEEHLAICDNTDDLEGIMLSEINQTRKTNTIWSHLYVESLKKRKEPIYIENHWWLPEAGDEGWANGWRESKGYEFSVIKQIGPGDIMGDVK